MMAVILRFAGIVLMIGREALNLLVIGAYLPLRPGEQKGL
jgi:hypothetical protein